MFMYLQRAFTLFHACGMSFYSLYTFYNCVGLRACGRTLICATRKPQNILNKNQLPHQQHITFFARNDVCGLIAHTPCSHLLVATVATGNHHTINFASHLQLMKRKYVNLFVLLFLQHAVRVIYVETLLV
jgi:hypothetical protein